VSSILTNTSALTALQSLANTQKQLQQTQNQISTGLRVSSASDNPAYWSIATQMKSDNMAISAVTDALGQTSSVLSVASTALTTTLDTLNSMKTDLVNASNPGADLSKLNTSLAQLGQQLQGVYGGASINNMNLTDGSMGSSINLVSGFHQTSSGASIDTITLNLQSLNPAGTGSTTTTATGADVTNASAVTTIKGLTDNTGTVSTPAYGTDEVKITQAASGTWATGDTALVKSKDANGTETDTTYTYDATNSKFTTSITTITPAAAGLLQQGSTDLTSLGSTTQVTAANASTLVNAVDAAIKAVTTYASQIGSVQSRITSQQTFMSAMSDALTNGVSALVDADMNKASTRLQALQVQQQLGVQSLSIANQNSQMILKLFGG
jgi:flagellin